MGKQLSIPTKVLIFFRITITHGVTVGGCCKVSDFLDYCGFGINNYLQNKAPHRATLGRVQAAHLGDGVRLERQQRRRDGRPHRPR